MYKSNLVIAFSIFLCLFCGCSLAIKAHEGEEQSQTLTASLLDGLWNVQKESVCSESSNLKFHAGHFPEAVSKLTLNFCSDEAENLFGIVKNQNRLDADERYEVASLIIDNGDNSFNITAQSEDLEELDIEIIDFNQETNKSFSVSFDGGTCYYSAKKIKAKPSRACTKLLNEN